jgi:hypothetical protein
MSDEQTPPTDTPTGHSLTITAGLLVLACLIGAAVALAYAGWDSGAILGLLTGITGVAVPLLAAVKGLVDMRKESHEQTQTLAKIDHQTNGALDARIESGVRKVMNEPINLIPVSPAAPA